MTPCPTCGQPRDNRPPRVFRCRACGRNVYVARCRGQRLRYCSDECASGAKRVQKRLWKRNLSRRLSTVVDEALEIPGVVSPRVMRSASRRWRA